MNSFLYSISSELEKYRKFPGSSGARTGPVSTAAGTGSNPVRELRSRKQSQNKPKKIINEKIF